MADGRLIFNVGWCIVGVANPKGIGVARHGPNRACALPSIFQALPLPRFNNLYIEESILLSITFVETRSVKF